mmetsp:Transcript_15996/g.22861  ORF Transcript_15996/g.22861 Transcript_15996/m.22861 type:complete len:187 (-) Transcript_15996:764-1324(-)
MTFISESFETFEAFSDAQRVVRLRECQKIQQQVIECQRLEEEERTRQLEQAERAKRLEKESSTSYWWGKRKMAKKDSEQVAVGSLITRTNESATNPLHGNNNSSSLDCSKISLDDVWACRALSLKCGNELIELKDCGKRITAEINDSRSTTNHCCTEEREILRLCVSRNAAALESRLKRRQDATKK